MVLLYSICRLRSAFQLAEFASEKRIERQHAPMSGLCLEILPGLDPYLIFSIPSVAADSIGAPFPGMLGSPPVQGTLVFSDELESG